MNSSTPLSNLSSSPSPSIPPTTLGTPTFSTHTHHTLLPTFPTSASLNHASQTFEGGLRGLERNGEDGSERVSEYVRTLKQEDQLDGSSMESSPASSIDLISSYSFSNTSSKSRKPSPPPLDLSSTRPNNITVSHQDSSLVVGSGRKIIPKTLSNSITTMKGMKVVVDRQAEKERIKSAFEVKDINATGVGAAITATEGMMTGRWRRASEEASRFGRNMEGENKQKKITSPPSHPLHDLAPRPWAAISPPSKPNSTLRSNAQPYTSSIAQAILPVSQRYPAPPSALMTSMRSAPPATTSFRGIDAKEITFDPFSSPIIPHKKLESFSISPPPPAPDFTSSSAKNPLGWTDDSLLLDFQGELQLGRRKSSPGVQVVVKEPLEAGSCEIGASRSILIGGIPKNIDPTILKDRIQEIIPFRAMVVSHLQKHGFVIVIFFDPRSTSTLAKAIQDGQLVLHAPGAIVSGERTIELEGLADEKVLHIAGRLIKKILADNVADVFLKMDAARPLLNRSELTVALVAFGEIQSLQSCLPDQSTFIASYYDSRNAVKAAEGLDNNYVHNTHLEVSVFCPSYLNTGVDGPTFTTGDLNLGTDQNAAAFGSSMKPHLPILKTLPYTAPPRGQPPQTPGRRQSSASSTLFTPTSFPEKTIPQTPEKMTSHLESRISPSSPLTLEQVRRERKRLEELEALLLSTPKPDQNFERYYPSRASAQLTPTRPRSTSVPSTPYSGKSDMFGDNSNTQSTRTTRSGTEFKPSGNMFPKTTFRSPSTQSTQRNKEVLYKEMVPVANRLSLEHLKQRKDDRTTVMVKDIPNKLTRQELIHVFEEVVPGKIDFLYLRFDFANKCNCGFAFVNFVSTEALLQFACARLGLKWNIFSSEKILQMSYANIQGLEALVAHFRNSSVMVVAEEWRPVILRKGKEVDFPGPTPERILRSTQSHHQQALDKAPHWRGPAYHYPPGSLAL